MRLLPLLILTLAASLPAAEPVPPAYPLWDNHESVADYAKRVNLPPTQTLDLGNGVKMDLVLIPAGKFIMGTPEPTPVDEFACRAGTSSVCYSGDTESASYKIAWHGNNSQNSTHPVGQKLANAFGLYDMQGNVWEWCQDCYEDKYYGKSPVEDPLNLAQSYYRSLRGASWIDLPWNCRSTQRFKEVPVGRSDIFGFRVVLESTFKH